MSILHVGNIISQVTLPWHRDFCRFHVWVAVLYLCLDYLLSTAALCFVTAKQAPGSRRAFRQLAQ